MHEPQASALRNRERHCIIRVHHIETRIVRKVCYKCFIAGHESARREREGYLKRESARRQRDGCAFH